MRAHLDALFAQGALGGHRAINQQVIEIEWPQMELPLGQRLEQHGQDLLETAGFSGDDLSGMLHGLNVIRLLREVSRPAADGDQRVSQIVRDARRHLADRRDLLRPDQLPLRLL